MHITVVGYISCGSHRDRCRAAHPIVLLLSETDRVNLILPIGANPSIICIICY
jgi:hypothetical protein